MAILRRRTPASAIWLAFGLALGASTADASVVIRGGNAPRGGDALLPDVEGTSGVELELSEAAVETLYPGGPISIRDPDLIILGLLGDLYIGGVQIPSTSGRVVLEAPLVAGPDGPVPFGTSGADLSIRGGAIAGDLRTQAVDGDRSGGNLVFEEFEPDRDGGSEFGDLTTDGGSDFDGSGGNDAGNVRLTAGALFIQRISANGSESGTPGLDAGDGGFVRLIQTASATTQNLIEAGNIGVSSGGEGGLPGSILIEADRLRVNGFTTFAASGPRPAVLPDDRGDVVIGADVTAPTMSAPTTTLSVEALGEIAFRGTVGVGEFDPGDRFNGVLVSEAHNVRFEDRVDMSLLRTVDPVGGLQFLGGFGTSSEIGEVSATATGGIDVFASVEIDQASLTASDGILIGGTRGSSAGDGALTLRDGTVSAGVTVGEAGGPFGVLTVEGGTVTFERPVVNTANGTMKNTDGTAIFDGGFTNFGAYLSDPADNFFSNLEIADAGYLRGGPGDRFIVAGNLISGSEASVLWGTTGAQLVFEAGIPEVSHLFSVGGEDRGAVAGGFTQNFAWGSLRLASGELLVFEDRDGDGGALYVRELILEDGLDHLKLLTLPAGVSLYYDRRAEANQYLLGEDYELPGGGILIASVPEPSLLALGLLACAGLARPRGPRPRNAERPAGTSGRGAGKRRTGRARGTGPNARRGRDFPRTDAHAHCSWRRPEPAFEGMGTMPNSRRTASRRCSQGRSQ